ncbi:uncharacterized protein LACBIDRAFT_330380 [Laccaria bicolor S238N-H82]|uniref:Predicted protein n=1 Tax=Laccaria bicolor (strain S238N-H82 / ATCC MYA-4686) TaxID=486041 RepID=B0DL46_LACBS|nr:uncharacterized protein LACBIDRAFT_330380 [Laccaria bicolor S238N-H82]EDR04765.1 predicted protein [Laccaria bicolor S238N-H82]|eukprot:XP_001884589.1 predicted protein [Laccaria bicolor S238N-H82]
MVAKQLDELDSVQDGEGVREGGHWDWKGRDQAVGQQGWNGLQRHSGIETHRPFVETRQMQRIRWALESNLNLPNFWVHGLPGQHYGFTCGFKRRGRKAGAYGCKRPRILFICGPEEPLPAISTTPLAFRQRLQRQTWRRIHTFEVGVLFVLDWLGMSASIKVVV